MKRNPVQRVTQLAQNRESVAAKKMADKINAHKLEEEKREQIKGYRTQYEANLDKLSEAGVSGRTLSEYRKFLCNLDDVINQQSSLVDTAAGHVDESRSEWLNKYHRKSALEQLVDLQQKEKMTLEEKREQKIVDEMNMHKRFDQ